MSPETKRERPPGAAEHGRFEPVPSSIVAGKYRVERTIGEGGMGLVVAATHLGLEQRVAIKFLLPEAARNKVAVERFLREARVAAMVRSEYVARVHDVGTLDDGMPFIVMEHLEGTDLGKMIARGGALPIEEACEITLQACEALAEVHAAGIVHRDLKPSNLFVTRRADGAPAVKLLDFGISKLGFGASDSSADLGLTATTTIMGSPSYMSPEQLKSTKEVDSRTDVWSLGAVLFEAVAGRPAFRGESMPQVCAMIASEDPPALSSLRAEAPPELERAVRGCLEKDPDKRIALADLAWVLAGLAPERARSCLERIEATLGVSPSRPRAPTHAPRESFARAMPAPGDYDGAPFDRAPQVRRRRSGLWAFLLLLVAAGGVLGVGLYASNSGDSGLRSKLEGATSAVTSAAASAVASAERRAEKAANAVSSAVASSIPPSPSDVPSASEVPRLPVASDVPRWPAPSEMPRLPFDTTAHPSSEPEPSEPEPQPSAAPSPQSSAAPPHASTLPAPKSAKPHPTRHHVKHRRRYY